MDKCDVCPEHSAVDRAIRQHDKRLDAHGAQLDAAIETLAAIKEIERQNQERIDGHDDRISALESAPARRWDTVTNYALTAILALVCGLIAGHFGF